MQEKLYKIEDRRVVINDEGDTQIADLIIENDYGFWYGIDLGSGEWEYLQDNGEYIPAPEMVSK